MLNQSISKKIINLGPVILLYYLSISEIDLVLQQLSGCFIAPAGAEIEKTIFVKVQ